MIGFLVALAVEVLVAAVFVAAVHALVSWPIWRIRWRLR